MAMNMHATGVGQDVCSHTSNMNSFRICGGLVHGNSMQGGAQEGNPPATTLASSIAVSGPYLLPVSLCIWNTQGLCSADGRKAKRKREALLRLVARFDIVLIQETHCGDFKQEFVEKCISNSHKCHWSPVPESSNSGGVGIIIKAELAAQFKIHTPVIIVLGRILALRLSGDNGALDVFCVHLEPALHTRDKIAQLSAIRRSIRSYESAHTILGGDWNFDLDLEDRLELDLATFQGDRGDVAIWWDSNLADLTEWFQGDYTRSGTTRTGRR